LVQISSIVEPVTTSIYTSFPLENWIFKLKYVSQLHKKLLLTYNNKRLWFYLSIFCISSQGDELKYKFTTKDPFSSQPVWPDLGWFFMHKIWSLFFPVWKCQIFFLFIFFLPFTFLKRRLSQSFHLIVVIIFISFFFVSQQKH